MQVQTLLLKLQQVHQRAFEVQRVRHHIPVEARDLECLHHQVLPGAGIGDVTDLLTLGVDERGKGVPGIDRHGRGVGRRVQEDKRYSGWCQRRAPFHGLVVGISRRAGHRMTEGAIEIGIPVSDREIGLARELRRHRAQARFGRTLGGIRLEAERCGGRQCANGGTQLPPSHVHAITSAAWQASLHYQRR